MLWKGAKSHVAQEISGRGRGRGRDEKGNQGVGDFRVINILQLVSICFFFYIRFSLLSFTHTHTHDPRPLPTTHDPRHLALLQDREDSSETPRCLWWSTADKGCQTTSTHDNMCEKTSKMMHCFKREPRNDKNMHITVLSQGLLSRIVDLLIIRNPLPRTVRTNQRCSGLATAY